MNLRHTFAATITGVALGWVSVFGQAEGTDPQVKPETVTIPSQSSTAQGITVQVQCPSILVSGSENYITIIVRNDGKRPVEYYPIAPQRHGVGYEVTRHSKPVGLTELGNGYLAPSVMPHVREPIRLESGHELRVIVNLTRYYDLSMPSRGYELVATWWGHFVGEEGQPIRIRTKHLDFEVIEKAGESVTGP